MKYDTRRKLLCILVCLFMIIGSVPLVFGIAPKDDTIDLFVDPVKNPEMCSIVKGKLQSLDVECVIGESHPFGMRSEHPPFFVVELEPVGYMIVTSSELLPPVVAYSFTSDIGSLDMKENMFLQMVSYDLASQYEFALKLPGDVVLPYESERKAYMNGESVISDEFKQWPPEGSTSTEGWITTRWDQGDPYNRCVPMDGDTRSLAGCVAIAMGQLLNYYETTMDVRLNGSDEYFHNYAQGAGQFHIDDEYEQYGFPSFLQLNVMLDVLDQHYASDSVTDDDHAALVFASGTALKQVYGDDGSGTFGVGQAFDAYVRFGFEESILWTEEDTGWQQAVAEDIMDAHPVHLAVVTPEWDAGHNVLIDGYNTDGYFHINFGWGGSADGWYLVPDELDVYGYEFTVLEGVLTGVYVTGDPAFGDLDVSGSMATNKIAPGTVVYDSFFVENIGEPGSLLDWNVSSIPDWGTWEITPSSGVDLTPEMGQVCVNVTLTAPSKRNTDFSGAIIVENVNVVSDMEAVPVMVSLPVEFAPLYDILDWLCDTLGWPCFFVHRM